MEALRQSLAQGTCPRVLGYPAEGRLTLMKLSIIILCWNDRKVIGDCLQSIYATTRSTEFEIIVSDNGSTDGSIEFVRENYPSVRIIENGMNLRFARANNVGNTGQPR